MEAVGVERLGEHVVVVAQHPVQPDLGRLGRRDRGGRGGGRGGRRRRRRAGRRARSRRGRVGRRRRQGHRRAGRLGRVGAVGAGGLVVGPGAGPVVRVGALGSRAVAGVLFRSLSVTRVRAAGGAGQPGVVGAAIALLLIARLVVVTALGGGRAARTGGQRARRVDERRVLRVRVTGGEAGDPEHDGHGSSGRAGHRHAHPEQPAAAAAYVVLGRHQRDTDPAGQRVQLLFEEAVGGVGHRRPPRWLVVVVVAVVPVRSAVRSLSRAAEVWLFTVPGLTPRSAAVSSTESPQ